MEAVIFSGIQATGKSSFCRERFFHSHVRVNRDMLRTRHRERLLIDACIAGKQAFVVDNTNPTRKARARYLEAARAAGIKTLGENPNWGGQLVEVADPKFDLARTEAFLTEMGGRNVTVVE